MSGATAVSLECVTDTNPHFRTSYPVIPGPRHAGAALQPYGPPPYAPPLVSAGGRLGALLLDILLAMVTLWIGWLLNLVTFSIYAFVDAFMVFGDRQRTLHDRLANSLVRHD